MFLIRLLYCLHSLNNVLNPDNTEVLSLFPTLIVQLIDFCNEYGICHGISFFSASIKLESIQIVSNIPKSSCCLGETVRSSLFAYNWTVSSNTNSSLRATLAHIPHYIQHLLLTVAHRYLYALEGMDFLKIQVHWHLDLFLVWLYMLDALKYSANSIL